MRLELNIKTYCKKTVFSFKEGMGKEKIMNIVVVGAGRGLGAVLSKMLAQKGHKVAAGLRTMQEQENSENLAYCPMDVTKEQEIKDAVESVKKWMGTVDVIVNVAGILLPADRTDTLLTEKLEDMRQQIEVNALGIITVFREFLPIIKEGGLFLAVTSEGGSFANAGSLFPAYGVSKTAANKIVQILRTTVEDRVEVLAVHPGRMNTDMGRTTAQIEPEAAAEGFCDLIEGKIKVNDKDQWFIDYLGKPLPL